MFRLRFFALIFSIFYCVQCHFLLETSKHLQPVHGLYVKPSSDGTTGDLYVAASEDDGVKSQWITDQPINFLSSASEHQPSKTHPITLTTTLTKNSSPNEETITSQKRAVITSPVVKYAYALPVPGADGNLLAPYPYVTPTVTASSEGSNISPCPTEIPTQAYSPYFYPYMLSALANAINSLKDVENSDENTPTIASQASPYWPHTYTYPYQYVMVDPKAWLQNQNAAPSSTISTTSSEST
ncbi:unnamed protein product, partial [Brenthis ino]